MSENNAGGAVEKPNENGDISFNKEILLEKSPEELAELVMKASAGTINAKKKIEELKAQAGKEVETEVKAPEGNFMTREEFEAEKFFESNPDMLEYKDKLESYTSKGINWNEAKVLVEQSDPTIAERQKTNSMNMTGNIINSGKSAYTMEELTKIAGTDQRAYNSLMEQVDKGEVTIT